MASVKFEKGSAEWQMFQDYYKICQKYWQPEQDETKAETYWLELGEDMNKFYNTYSTIPLAKRIVSAFYHSMVKKSQIYQQ